MKLAGNRTTSSRVKDCERDRVTASPVLLLPAVLEGARVSVRWVTHFGVCRGVHLAPRRSPGCSDRTHEDAERAGSAARAYSSAGGLCGAEASLPPPASFRSEPKPLWAVSGRPGGMLRLCSAAVCGWDCFGGRRFAFCSHKALLRRWKGTQARSVGVPAVV